MNLKDETEEKEPEIEKEPEGPEEVPVDPEETDDDEDDEPEPAAARGPTRAEKRASRKNYYREQKEGRERAEREALELKTQLAQAQAAAAQAQAWAHQQLSQAGQQRQPDPYETEESRLDKEYDLVEANYRNRLNDKARPMTPEEQREFQKQAREIESKRIDLRVARRVQGMQPQQTNPMEAHLHLRYPEVMRDQAAFMFADGEARKIQATTRQQQLTLEQVEAIMDQTEQRFRLGRYRNAAQVQQQQRAPDPSLRQKLQSPGRGASGGSTEGVKRSVAVTPKMVSRARAVFPHMAKKSDREVVEKWAQTVGKKLIDKNVDLDDLA